MDELPSNLTIKELTESGLPSGQQSAIRRWYESVKGGGSAMARAKQHAAAAGHAIRQGGESLLVGGLLGAAHAELKTGLDVKNVPIDAVTGVVGLLTGAAMAHEEYGVDLRNMGATGAGIFAFRKTYQLIAQKKRQAGEQPGGTFAGEIHNDPNTPDPNWPGQTHQLAQGHFNGSDYGAEDPIVAAARFL